MPNPDKTLSITRGAASLLAQALSVPTWSNDAGEKYRAGELIEGPLAVAIDAPMESKAKLDAWCNVGETVVLTDRQMTVAKKCVGACLSNLPCGKHLNSLLNALGLAPE